MFSYFFVLGVILSYLRVNRLLELLEIWNMYIRTYASHHSSNLSFSKEIMRYVQG